MEAEEFASFAHIPLADIEHYTVAGLLDANADGMYGAVDLLRAYVIRAELGAGRTLDEIRAESRQSLKSIFPSGRQQTFDETATALGVEEQSIRQLATALGFRERVATERTLGLYKAALQFPIEWERLIEGARVYADSLDKLARVVVDLIHRDFCRSGGSDSAHGAVAVVEQLASLWPYLSSELSTFVEAIFNAALFEAMAAHAVAHLNNSDGAGSGGFDVTIVFVDLAASSALAETEGDDALFNVVDRLDLTVRDLALKHGGKLVKEDGDGFMLSFTDPVAAVHFAIAVERHVSVTEPMYISTRIGMHTGPMLFRLGDYFGQAVNVAHRVASMAMPHTILVTEPIARAATTAGISVEDIGVRTLRGMDAPMPVFRVGSGRSDEELR